MDKKEPEKNEEGFDTSPFKPPAKRSKIDEQQSDKLVRSVSLTSQESVDTSIALQSTPITSSHIIKQHKPHIYKFLEKLFKIDMSQDTLVDIVINDDINSNQTIIVGRPKLLGSAVKQMRHVTPYSFIEKAIKATIVATEGESDYILYINNILEAIKPLIKSKEGICLTVDQYSKLKSSIIVQDEGSKEFKFSTISKEQKKSEYHLIYNEALIKKFEKCQVFL